MSINSALPPQAAFHHAVLRHLARRPSGERRAAVYEAVADLLKLDEAQRAERLANMPHLRYRHRTGWSLGILNKRGYVESIEPRIWRIADQGRDLLTRYPEGFAEKTAFQLVRESGEKASAAEEAASYTAAQQTPEERIVAALDEIRRDVAVELLQRIAEAPPAFFEGLVLDLLHALGYGASQGDLERVGRGADGGIDGVISLDKLGLERVCVQAKRWQGSVGRPDVQAFYGALAGRRARKGVFITTSTFTREAQEYAGQIAESIVLIDGSRLTSLMIEHGVGVDHYRVLALPKIDSDYFDTD